MPEDQDATPSTTRRTLLAELSVVGMVGLAGCGGSGDGDGGDGGTATPTATATDTPADTGTSMDFGVTAAEPQSVGAMTATLAGDLAGLGGADAVDAGFEYRQAGGEEWTASPTASRSSPGEYTVEIDGLRPDTEYEFRAVATTSGGESATSESSTFDTAVAARLSGIDDVSATGATVAVSLSEGVTEGEIEVEYRTLLSDTWESAAPVAVEPGATTVEKSVTGLDIRSIYEARATFRAGDYESTTVSLSFTTPNDGEAADDSTYETAAAHHPGDGFADFGAWLDDDTAVLRVSELSREKLETAFQVDQPRLIVFETSGSLNLGGEPIEITNDKCWVAGQTAPSPGVTFVQGALRVSANDCVVQHLRSRHGPGTGDEIQSFDSANTADETENNVFDHVTASWGTDECLSVGYTSENTTVTNCLIYEGLYSPYGEESDHNYGSLIGNDAVNVTLAGNVWAKCRGRMPRLKSGTRSALVNNLMYFFSYATWLDEDAESSIVGNLYALPTDDDSPITGGNAYLEDNVVEPDDRPVAGESGLGPAPDELDSKPLWPDGLSAIPSGEVESHNLQHAGARPGDRTPNDVRIVEEIRDRAGDDSLNSPYDYWVPNVESVGGFPDLDSNTHTLEVPDEGTRAWLGEWAQQVETSA